MEEETIDIPVKPHVRQYLEINIFITKPFRVNENDLVGMYLLELLQPKKKAKLPLRYNRANVMTVSLGFRKQYNYKRWLPKENANKFNLFVKKLIDKEYKEFMETVLMKTEKSKVDRLIKEFEVKYCLENTNMSFSSLKRQFYRSREASETPMKSS